MIEKEILHKINEYVFELLKNEGTGHDYFHIQRVVKNVEVICKAEQINSFYPVLLALLHDVGDYKLYAGIDRTEEMVRQALENLKLEELFIQKVITDIDAIGFKGGFNAKSQNINVQIVQDADKLDAMGAIGIARAFAYGGSKKSLLHDPNFETKKIESIEEYKNAKRPTIQHFYDKLLKLKDLMHTKTGKLMAQERHAFMELFLNQFYKEWNG